MNQLPQHQRDLDNLNFVNDLRQYIVKFDNESMIMRIPESEFARGYINIVEALKFL